MSIATTTTNSLSPTLTAAHCRVLIDSMSEFYSNPANRAEFERWRETKHGDKSREASYIQSNSMKGGIIFDK